MGAALDLGILGPFELRVDGGVPVAVGGQRQKSLLALLALRANEVVSTDRLVDQLWRDGHPRRAPHALREAVHRLRGALGAASDRLVTTPPGYRLALSVNETDAGRFEDMYRRAQAAMSAGDPARAATLLHEAEALWRGPPLADFSYEQFAQTEIARLEELRISCREELIDAELSLGLHHRLVSVLEPLVFEHPLRERLHAQLMLALYRSGRQADALEAFQQARRRLLDVGLEPGPPLRDLEREILRQDPSLLAPRLSPSRGGRLAPAPKASLPPPLRTTPSTPYVGRQAEMKVAAQALAKVCAASRRVVVIEGEPGVGKSRLAACIAMEAHECDLPIAWATASEGLGAPYALWLTLLSHLVEHASPDLIEPVVARHGPPLARLVPAVAQRFEATSELRSDDAETERYLMFQAVIALLESLTSARPVVLVLDDLQWADGPTLSLLEHVGSAASHLGLFLIITYRASDIANGHPLLHTLAALHRLDGVDRIALTGLTRDEVQELITEIAGHEMDGAELELAAEIAEETGGNPFYVGEILRHLREREVISQDEAGRWTISAAAKIGLPQSLREVVLDRVSQLGETATMVLGSAAVIGDSFTPEFLTRIVDRDESEVLETLERAVRKGVLFEPADDAGAFAFTHALFKHCLYEDLVVARRQIIHRRIAEVIEAVMGAGWEAYASELAYHSIAGGAEPGKVITFARTAGEQALSQLAPEHALTWFDEALWHLGPDQDEGTHCDLLIGRGIAKRQLGDATFREDLLDASARAQVIGDLERMTRAALENTLGPLGAVGPPDLDRVEALRHVLDRLPEVSPDFPLVQATLAKETYYGGDPVGGVKLAQHAVDAARARRDTRRLARVMSFTVAISPLADLDEHAAYVDELANLGQELGDPEIQFRAANLRFIHSMHSGEREAVDEAAAAMETLADQVGQPIMRWTTLWAQSAQSWIEGQLAQSEALTLKAAELNEAHRFPGAPVITFGQRLAVLTEQARLDELLPELQARLAAHPNLPVLHLARGFIDAEQGRISEAAAVLMEHARAGFQFHYDRTRAFNLARCADIAIRVRSHGVPRQLYEALMPHRSEFATPAGVSTRGSVELILGRLASTLGEFAKADGHLERALEVHQRFGAPLLLARTYLATGESLTARGEPGHAEEELGKALALAHAHGSVAIGREAEALLAGSVEVTPAGS